MNKLGLVLANERAEYLCHFSTSPGLQNLVWSPLPSLAIRFTGRGQIKKIKKAISDYQLFVLTLYEDETRYYVTGDCANSPPWMAN